MVYFVKIKKKCFWAKCVLEVVKVAGVRIAAEIESETFFEARQNRPELRNFENENFMHKTSQVCVSPQAFLGKIGVFKRYKPDTFYDIVDTFWSKVSICAYFSQNVHHTLSGVTHYANSKCAGKSRPWRIQRWVERRNPTPWIWSRHVWSRK